MKPPSAVRSSGRVPFLSILITIFFVTLGHLALAQVVPTGEDFPIALGQGVEIQGKPGIAFGTSDFLVVWSHLDSNSTYGARVSLSGEVLDDPPLPISVGLDTDSRHVSVGWDGANWLVAWVAVRSAHPGVGEIYVSRIAPDGTILDPTGVRVTFGAGAKVRMVGMAYDGTNFLIVWRSNSNNILGTRVTPVGVNLDAPVGFSVCSNGSAYYPSVAFDGTNFMTNWHDSRNGAYDQWAARITPGGITLDPGGFRVTDDATYQEHGTIVFNGVDFMIQWYERGPGADPAFGSSRAARVTTSGSVLDPEPFPIFDRTRGQIPVQAACDGTECVVVASWPQGRERKHRMDDVYGRRIDQAGSILESKGIPVSTEFWHQFGPVIGYGSGRYLVAWGDRRDTDSPSIWARMLEVQTREGSHTRAPDPDRSTKPATSGAEVPNHAALKGVGWAVEAIPGPWAGSGLALDASNSYSFGDEVYHNTGGGWSQEYVRDNLFGAWASGPDFIWVSGWARCFLHRDGGGWGLPSCNGEGACFAVWGSGRDNVWSSCNGGEFLRLVEPSQTWDLVPTQSSASLWDIWGAAEDDVWAVGSAGSVVYYDGKHWTQHPSVPTGHSLNGVWGSGADDVFAVGDWGTILHFDGMSWSEQGSVTNEHLFDVWGAGPNDVFAVGDSGTIVRYDGLSWRMEASGTTQDLLAVWGHLLPDGSRYKVWTSGIGDTILSKADEIRLFCDGFESGTTSAWTLTSQ